MNPRIAFIGLGIMGRSMASRLLGAGCDLTIHTRTMSKAAELIERGAKPAGSPADAAAAAEIVFICVTDTPDVECVILGGQGREGVIHRARQGMIVVDHSTISPGATREMAEKLAARGATLLDAPISGGDVGAREGTLAIMVGGEAAAFARAEPLLKRMGKTITHCGPSGSGQLTKLVNQILVSVTNLAVCEAMVFAKKSGLDPAKTLGAIGGGAAGSWQLANLAPKMIAGDFRPGFMVDLQQKDLRLVLQAAAQSHTPLAAVSLVNQLLSDVQAAGGGGEGTQALYKVVEKLAEGDSEC